MEGRYPHGTHWVLLSCADPGGEEGFLRWYWEEHLPGLEATGAFSALLAFRDLEVGAEGVRFLTVGEVVEGWDLGSLAAGGVVDGSSLPPGVGLVGEQTWGRLGGAFTSARTGRADVMGILVVSSESSDGSQLEAWHEWYDTVHIPDVIDTQLYHTVYRFESVGDRAGQAPFLAIYETSARDLVEADREYREVWRARWRAEGRNSPVHRNLGRAVYRRI